MKIKKTIFHPKKCFPKSKFFYNTKTTPNNQNLRIKNKSTILKEIDDQLTKKPPSLEYLLVLPGLSLLFNLFFIFISFYTKKKKTKKK